MVPMSTASAVLRHTLYLFIVDFSLVPMSTASAVLRLDVVFTILGPRGVPMSTASAVLRQKPFQILFCSRVVVPMSTASARGVTPHLMRGPVPALFRVFPGFRVVARNDGAVYCFDTG